MRIVSAILPAEIEIEAGRVTSMVIENPNLFLRLLKELYTLNSQFSGLTTGDFAWVSP